MPERTSKAALIRRDGGALLDRLFETRDIAAIVPQLPPDAPIASSIRLIAPSNVPGAPDGVMT